MNEDRTLTDSRHEIGTVGSADVLNPAANFDLYRRRQELIAKRNATTDPVKREQINILIEQLTNYDRATGMQRLAMAPAIERQMQLVAL